MLTESDKARFWSKVDKNGPGGCWLWAGAVFKRRGGYGAFNVRRRVFKAHRLSASLAGLSIDGLFVCHRCDNPSCVNPDHLFVGTTADNLADAARKGRTSRGEHRPAARLTEEKARALYACVQGGMTYQAAADRFGVAMITAYKLCRGITWRYLGLPVLPKRRCGAS